jgi:cellulose synthase/poly-beta-1,6-N-acetylglucosamine synthase-like glycosyltransferase
MAVFLLAFTAVGFVILSLHLALAAGVIANFARDRRRGRGGPPGADAEACAGANAEACAGANAEVIVAVRNEEATLPALLASLARQTAGSCRFLFVDDRSADATGRMLDDFCRAVGPRAKVIHNTREPSGLTGKQAALDMALGAAEGRILLFTDGDCVVPDGWVREMLGYFRDPAVGAVLARIELEPGGSFLGRFQAFEQPLINQYNFGNAGLGVPMGCFGNNMALRAEVVRDVGGFAGLGYSVTEDAALIAAVGRLPRWKVRVSTLAATATVTQPKRTWAEYVNQHTRWNAGAFFARDLTTRAAYGFVVVYLMLCVLLLPFGVLDGRIALLSLNAFVSMGILGFLGGLYPGKRALSYFLRFVPYMVFFGFFYSFVSARALVLRPLEWKGSVLAPKRGRTPSR